MTASIVQRATRKKRTNKGLDLKAGKWLIVCGALQTEINYIQGLIDKINEYSPNDKKIIYELVPIPLDPKNLVEKIRREVAICTSKYDVRFSKIFVVFDKDDFLNEDYNRAIQMCKNNDYIAIYSNECFELWLYLHFKYTDVLINRVDLIKKLEEIFKEKGIGTYDKNDTKLFEKMFNYGDILKAMVRAEKLKENYSQGSSKALQVPLTKMNVLLDQIEFHQKEYGLKSIYEMLKK